MFYKYALEVQYHVMLILQWLVVQSLSEKKENRDVFIGQCSLHLSCDVK